VELYNELYNQVCNYFYFSDPHRTTETPGEAPFPPFPSYLPLPFVLSLSPFFWPSLSSFLPCPTLPFLPLSRSGSLKSSWVSGGELKFLLLAVSSGCPVVKRFLLYIQYRIVQKVQIKKLVKIATEYKVTLA